MSKLFKIKHYIYYLIRAKGAFSVHSPFVFTLFNNVIKRKNVQKGSKKEQLIENIYLFYPNFTIINLSVKTNYENILSVIKKPYTIIIFPDINSNKENYLTWKEIINSENKFISVNIWHIGLLINNPNIKQKQNYILK
ncbi:MAG: hypothetical protein IJ759_04635 [Bacteroidales bacterium]|nr:hypothetical protein [Bacteroidales bacterium]